jgi:hypothetical protein
MGNNKAGRKGTLHLEYLSGTAVDKLLKYIYSGSIIEMAECGTDVIVELVNASKEVCVCLCVFSYQNITNGF